MCMYSFDSLNVSHVMQRTPTADERLSCDLYHTPRQQGLGLHAEQMTSRLAEPSVAFNFRQPATSAIFAASNRRHGRRHQKPSRIRVPALHPALPEAAAADLRERSRAAGHLRCGVRGRRPRGSQSLDRVT